MSPNALAITSVGAPASAVTPVLAALDATGIALRALDVGRLGSSSEATLDRVLKVVSGELAERRLAREWAQNPPDVALGFDPGSVSALVAVKRSQARPAPVVAIVPELCPGPAWGDVAADRFLAVDDLAAATLSQHGVPVDRVLVVGPLAEVDFAAAGEKDVGAVRKKFKLEASGRVVLLDVEGFGYELTSQVALQLSLVEEPAMFLFDAGRDADAAAALRAQVPALDLRAKLFGVTDDAPLFWRTADVIVARPSSRAISRCLAVGARMVCLCDSDSDRARVAAQGLEDRGRGQAATTPLYLSSALEPLLRLKKRFKSGGDGAGNAADIVFVVGHDRDELLKEVRSASQAETTARVDEISSAASRAEDMHRAPGELEDLGGGGASPVPPPVNRLEIDRLVLKLETRKERLEKTIADAHTAADKWQRRREQAAKDGGGDVARHAERNADLERARMHEALADLAQVQSELARLNNAAKAPRPPKAQTNKPRRSAGGGTSAHSSSSVDDMLNDMKKSQGGAGTRGAAPRAGKKKKRASSVDAELEALKKKMKKGPKKK